DGFLRAAEDHLRRFRPDGPIRSRGRRPNGALARCREFFGNRLSGSEEGRPPPNFHGNGQPSTPRFVRCIVVFTASYCGEGVPTWRGRRRDGRFMEGGGSLARY